MSGRKLNAIERRLHQYALARPQTVVNQKELEALVPDAQSRLDSINFLLGTGLFVALELRGAELSYRAVSHSEIELKKDLSREEGLVLDRIRAAGDEGIWTKHIKAKTQLHQTIVDKCLKSLTQKQLVKTVNDVRHTTRKIYMLSNVEPSVELTGGPWYTDKELDTEFIKLLTDVCLKIIRDRSLPKARNDDNGQIRQLYPLSQASYPNAQQILGLLNKSRITETVLMVEHVNMLLEVLVLDGKIEKLPAFDIAALDEVDDSEEEGLGLGGRDECATSRTKQSKKTLSKRKRREVMSDDSDERDERRRQSSHQASRSSSRRDSKRRKSRHSGNDDDDDNNDNNDNNDEADIVDSKPHLKRSRRPDSSSESDHTHVRKRVKGKGRKRGSSPSNSSDGVSDTDVSSESDTSGRWKHSSLDKKARVFLTTMKGLHLHCQEGQVSALPAIAQDVGDSHYVGGAVYRAVYEEHIRGFGLDQAPCVQCPTFDFCKPGGPVNPQECVYYQNWLSQGTTAL